MKKNLHMGAKIWVEKKFWERRIEGLSWRRLYIWQWGIWDVYEEEEDVYDKGDEVDDVAGDQEEECLKQEWRSSRRSRMYMMMKKRNTYMMMKE